MEFKVCEGINCYTFMEEMIPSGSHPYSENNPVTLLRPRRGRTVGGKFIFYKRLTPSGSEITKSIYRQRLYYPQDFAKFAALIFYYG